MNSCYLKFPNRQEWLTTVLTVVPVVMVTIQYPVPCLDLWKSTNSAAEGVLFGWRDSKTGVTDLIQFS